MHTNYQARGFLGNHSQGEKRRNRPDSLREGCPRYKVTLKGRPLTEWATGSLSDQDGAVTCPFSAGPGTVASSQRVLSERMKLGILSYFSLLWAPG